MPAEIGPHRSAHDGEVRTQQLQSVPLASPFIHVGGFCWRTEVPPELLSQADSPDNPRQSPWRLFEDGRPIGRPHAGHDDIIDNGHGIYSHWRSTFYFSSSDNSEPNANDRNYELRIVGSMSAAAKDEVKSGALEWLPPIVNAGAAGAALSHLADILRRRGVREVRYFHTDHFEPWVGTDEQKWRALERFAQLTGRSAFGHRLSLFHTPLVNFGLVGAQRTSGYHALEDDNVAFAERPQWLADKCRGLLRPLEAEIGHEFHIHVHHENWTRTGYPNPTNAVWAWASEHSTPDADGRRFDLFVRLCRETLEHDIGRPFDSWAFVHGNWTLNASDDRFCQIENEISLLMRQGCFGDFTFPAPNPRCQPSLIQTPYTCLPVAGAKAYDSAAADPRPIAQGAGMLRPDRFFVWNSPIPAAQVSLDYYVEENRDRFKEPEEVVRGWLEQSVVIDGKLYLKTHSHSLYPDYRVWEEGNIPHVYPDVIGLFELLQRVCDAAVVPFVPTTVGEVMAGLHEFDRADDTRPPAEVAANAGTAVPDGAAEPTAPLIYPLKRPFPHRSGDAWIARLPWEFEADADTGEAPRRSQWRLLEDGLPLRQAHAAHSEIAELGAGLYSHWLVQLYFSTSDHTDPNLNGREYALEWTGPGDKPWLVRLNEAPVAQALSFGPRPEVQGCSGLIAIFGASFSGSTLVNAMLGAHPLIFGGGEMHWLINDPTRSECAVCGASCAFWTAAARAA